MQIISVRDSMSPSKCGQVGKSTAGELSAARVLVLTAGGPVPFWNKH